MQQLTEDDFKDPKVIQNLKRASVSPVSLAKRGSTLNVLAKAGFNARSLKKIEVFHPDDFKKNFSPHQLRVAGFDEDFFTQPEGRPKALSKTQEAAMLAKLKEQRNSFMQMAESLRDAQWQGRIREIDSQISHLELVTNSSSKKR